jgi:dolichol-phosphate mannosyltransferase
MDAEAILVADVEAHPRLSVVAPCYNEEQGLLAFVERMEAACRAPTGAGGSYEIILVNDGSSDATWPCMQALAKTRPGVIAVNLSRNHGHQLAVTAGLAVARGERVLIIDADLQDPPELLAEMNAKMNEGFDVVYGRRRVRAGETAFKRLSAHLYYRLLSRLSDVRIPADTGDFRLMTRRMVDRLNAMPEQDRYLRGMVAWLGGAQTEVLFDRPQRAAGETGYSLAKMIRLSLAGLTSFSTRPLHIAALFTAAGVFCGGLFALYSLWSLASGHVIPGWTSLAMLVILFSTCQLACLAVLSLYVSRIFVEVKQRPLFLIDSVERSPMIGLGVPKDLDHAAPPAAAHKAA